MKTKTTIAAGLLLLAAMAARADLVTFNYSGRVTMAGEQAVAKVGDSFRGSITIVAGVEPTFSDFPDPNTGEFFGTIDDPTPAYSLSFDRVGGVSGFRVVVIVNDDPSGGGDFLSMGGEAGDGPQASMELSDRTGKAISSTEWNPTDFDPQRWHGGRFSFRVNSGDGAGDYSGVITNVPDWGSSGLLLLIGLSCIALRRLA